MDASSSTITSLAARVAKAKFSSIPISTSSIPVSSHRIERDRTKLPSIALPTFQGDILQWPTFWQKFSAAVDCHDDLPESTKLAYLRTSIQDPEAELILNPAMDSPDTYKRLVKELHQRYERTKKIHRELVEKLVNLPAAKHNSTDLRKLVDATTNYVECLESTGHFTLESFISSLVYNKLPYKMQIDWDNDQADDKKILPYSKLLEYVTRKAFTLSDHKSSTVKPVDPPEKKTPKSVQEKKQQHRPKSYVHAVNSTPSSTKPAYKWECSLCRPEKHPLYVCSKWAGFTLQQWLDHVKNKSLCANCLGFGHSTANCKSTYRCKDCQQPHHSTLHKENTHQVNSTISQSQQVPDALLMTADVLLKGPGGQELKARAFLDPGASISLISSRVTQILDLPLKPSKINFTGAQGTPCKGAKHLTTVTISPLHQRKEIECRPAVVQVVTDDIPSRPTAPASEFHHLIGLRLSDPNFHLPARIDILLGADVWLQLQTGEAPITGPASEPGAQATIFGWAITGPATHQGEDETVHSTHHIQTVPWDQHADQIHQFWLSEDVSPPETTISELDAMVEQHYEDNICYDSSNQRYQVALPKNPDCQPLGESRPQAVQRFLSNERNIEKKDVSSAFNEQLQAYLDLHHAEKVPAEELLHSHYYLPMHFVTKSSSTSTKLRVVFDASARTSNGISLNQLLMVGPTLQPTLGNTLIRFRTYPVALSADISKMYREVKLAPKDRDLHRFVWRPDPSQPLEDYRMTRVTFGVTSSPYLAIKTLQQTATDHGGGLPIAQNHIRQSFYVDDFLAGADTAEEALQLVHDIRSILKHGGFNLCKWRSSSNTVLHNISEALREKLPIKDLTDLHSSYPKALGLEWNSNTDQMSPCINVSQTYKSTKRGIISDVSKTFDILGWISPTILSMKLLYQHLWEKGQEWDDTVPPSLADQHSKWRNELPCLSKQMLPRCYTILDSTISSQELHGFSDASLKAYGAVVYLRTTYDSHPATVSLVIAKTKVTKKNPPTIPKLELCGAVLLTKLLKQVSTTLDIPPNKVHAWTDSSIVLAWLDGHPRDFKQFVANRVSIILETTSPCTWKHVPTAENPADCSSRGLMPSELFQHNLWWNGPGWLHLDPVQVPDQPARRTLPLPEVRVIHAIICQPDISIQMEARTSNYHRIVTITAWCLRLYDRLRNGRPDPDNRGKLLKGLELQQAEHWLWKHSQARSFSKEFQALNKQHHIAPSSRLRSLNPFMGTDGLIRVGGRVANSSLSLSQQHPVIVDSKDSLIQKYFRHLHVCLEHCGPSLLLCSTGNRLHVLGARQLSRTVCSQCITCRRKNPRPIPQQMGNLPEERTTSSQAAFTETGIDFAGPFTLKLSHTRRPVKVPAFICVFVCLATKAVHLEATTDLTTETFIACLKRFIARRNCPTTIHSDSGPNFVGAHNDLRKLYQLLEEEESHSVIHRYLLQNRVTWTHSPARAPHFGGLWESAVKSMKRHLNKIMGSLLFTYEELTTIICQVEACLNSRPLIPMTSHNLDGLATLTASHFLLSKAPRAYPEDPRLPEEPRLLRRWNQCQSVVHHFWRRWSREYLHTLQSRTKWQHSKPNLRVGDIVIYKDEKSIACKWPLAKVILTYPGEDGLVRVVKIKTKSTEFKRPVTKISLLFRPGEQQAYTTSPASPGSMSGQDATPAASDQTSEEMDPGPCDQTEVDAS